MSRRLPLGMTDFNLLCNDVKTLVEAEIPTITDRDIRFIVATNILHMGPNQSEVSVQDLVTTIFAGAAKQVASQVFQDIKLQQKEEEAAVKALADSQLSDESKV